MPKPLQSTSSIAIYTRCSLILEVLIELTWRICCPSRQCIIFTATHEQTGEPVIQITRSPLSDVSSSLVWLLFEFPDGITMDGTISAC